MRSIAVINQKGGVGKTVTAVHLAAGLARYGRRVLLIDLDPQAHASLHFGVQLSGEQPSLYDTLVHGAPLADAMRSVTERLALLPGSIDLVGVDLELHQRDQREGILAGALAAYRDAFEYCLIDCPPSLGLLTVNALAAVEEVIIPLQPHFLALQGLGRLLETVELARQSLNPRLRVSGIVLCLYEKSTRLAQEVLDDITQFLRHADTDAPWHGARVFETKIRRSIKLAECPSFGQTVFDYAPGSHGAEDYLALTREVLDGWEHGATAPVSVPLEAVGAPRGVSPALAAEPPARVARTVSAGAAVAGIPAREERSTA